MQNQESCCEKKRFCWEWFIPVIAALAGILFILLRMRKNTGSTADPKPATEPAANKEHKTILLPDIMPSGSLPRIDDLTIIEGIGPKIAVVLQDAGIHTYSTLAASTPAQISILLKNAGIRLGTPATWPEQAGLAARGKWDELKALQATLKAGRRA